MLFNSFIFLYFLGFVLALGTNLNSTAIAKPLKT